MCWEGRRSELCKDEQLNDGRHEERTKHSLVMIRRDEETNSALSLAMDGSALTCMLDSAVKSGTSDLDQAPPIPFNAREASGTETSALRTLAHHIGTSRSPELNATTLTCVSHRFKPSLQPFREEPFDLARSITVRDPFANHLCYEYTVSTLEIVMADGCRRRCPPPRTARRHATPTNWPGLSANANRGVWTREQYPVSGQSNASHLLLRYARVCAVFCIE